MSLNSSDSLVRRLVKEPLVHFLAVALVVVIADRVYVTRHDRYRIVMTPERVTQVVESYRLQYGVDPGPDLREALVEQDLEDQVLYREALSLRLDRDDEIIRRRLIQKMQFVTQDQRAPTEPAAADLEKYFTSHHDRYRASPEATFTHVFFSVDAHGEAGARLRALDVLATLARTEPERGPSLGDPFPDRYDFSRYEPQQVARLFGETQFSSEVFAAPIGCWVGPFRSAYGWHLLRIDARRPAADPAFAEVKDSVRSDYLDDFQKAANAEALARLKQKYSFIREDVRESR
jgi:peptidyl-prolyl cis-trans isomerase C